MSAETINLNDIKPGPIRHHSLPDDLLQRIAATYRQIGRYVSPSLEQWELGFMRETNPDNEVVIWEKFATALQTYRRKCRKRSAKQTMRLIVQTLIRIQMGVLDEDIVGAGIDKVTIRQLRACLKEAGIKPGRGVIVVRPGLPKSPIRIPFADIFDGDGLNESGNPPPYLLIRFANVVLAEHKLTEQGWTVYGRERLDRICEEGTEGDAVVVIVELDHLAPDYVDELDDLDKLCALVKVQKGRQEGVAYNDDSDE